LEHTPGYGYRQQPKRKASTGEGIAGMKMMIIMSSALGSGAMDVRRMDIPTEAVPVSASAALQPGDERATFR
jgi:hypothetical protein